MVMVVSILMRMVTSSKEMTEIVMEMAKVMGMAVVMVMTYHIGDI